METHKKECPLEMIQCDYYNVGCETRMVHTNKQEHDEVNTSRHLMLTKQKLVSTEDQLANAIQQINALKILIHTSVQWMVKLTTMATLFELGDQICPVIIKVSEYSEKVENDVSRYSNPSILTMWDTECVCICILVAMIMVKAHICQCFSML